jgi:hypothetical protein
LDFVHKFFMRFRYQIITACKSIRGIYPATQSMKTIL